MLFWIKKKTLSEYLHYLSMILFHAINFTIKLKNCKHGECFEWSEAHINSAIETANFLAVFFFWLLFIGRSIDAFFAIFWVFFFKWLILLKCCLFLWELEESIKTVFMMTTSSSAPSATQTLDVLISMRFGNSCAINDYKYFTLSIDLFQFICFYRDDIYMELEFQQSQVSELFGN